MCNYGSCVIRLPKRNKSAIHLNGETAVFVKCA